MLVRQLHRVPPFTHLSQVAEALKGSDIAPQGHRDCATEAKGAYAGEIAASMIAALGCKYVILGHSERRQYYGETSATLNKEDGAGLRQRPDPDLLRRREPRRA